MAKRALLVGCGYPGTSGQLLGCWGDVEKMFGILVKQKGFRPQDITVLTDKIEEAAETRATLSNMIKHLSVMVSESQPGDVAFFHFSGHGTQVPDLDGDEKDGFDEALCPTDFEESGFLVDDVIKEIVDQLSEDVQFTFVADCCHSENMLDQRVIQIGGQKKEVMLPDLVGKQSLAACAEGEQLGMRSRSMPLEKTLTTLAALQSKQLGREVEASAESIKSAARSLGDKSVLKCGKRAAVNKKNKNRRRRKGKKGAAAGSGGEDKQQKKLKMVLISGCQSHEYSADAMIGSSNCGALTNAIEQVMCRNPNMSNLELVARVRALLTIQGFDQNPCLECSEEDANSSFICWYDSTAPITLRLDHLVIGEHLAKMMTKSNILHSCVARYDSLKKAGDSDKVTMKDIAETFHNRLLGVKLFKLVDTDKSGCLSPKEYFEFQTLLDRAAAFCDSCYRPLMADEARYVAEGEEEKDLCERCFNDPDCELKEAYEFEAVEELDKFPVWCGSWLRGLVKQVLSVLSQQIEGFNEDEIPKSALPLICELIDRRMDFAEKIWEKVDYDHSGALDVFEFLQFIVAVNEISFCDLCHDKAIVRDYGSGFRAMMPNGAEMLLCEQCVKYEKPLSLERFGPVSLTGMGLAFIDGKWSVPEINRDQFQPWRYFLDEEFETDPEKHLQAFFAH